ncbi:MAG: transposase [Arenicella sp.]|jgi:transposase
MYLNARLIVWFIIAEGHAQHIKPFMRGNKTDANDAVAIIEASQRPDLRFVPLKKTHQQNIQCLHRIRDRLV